MAPRTIRQRLSTSASLHTSRLPQREANGITLRFLSEERRHPDNGIWLCPTCAKLIDNDASRFTAKLLRPWKEIAEDRAFCSIGKTFASPT